MDQAIPDGIAQVPVTPDMDHMEDDNLINVNPFDLAHGLAWNNVDQRNAQHADGNEASLARTLSTPTDGIGGTRSGEELLRRLSLHDPLAVEPDPKEADPRVAHPNLNLSGHVISATFTVPYKIGFASGKDWVSHIQITCDCRPEHN